MWYSRYTTYTWVTIITRILLTLKLHLISAQHTTPTLRLSIFRWCISLDLILLMWLNSHTTWGCFWRTMTCIFTRTHTTIYMIVHFVTIAPFYLSAHLDEWIEFAPFSLYIWTFLIALTILIYLITVCMHIFRLILQI